MNRIILCLLSICFLSTSCAESQIMPTKETDLKNGQLKGHVKKVETVAYSSNYGTKVGKLWSSTTTYDECGYITQHQRYVYPQGQLTENYLYVNAYDDNDVLIQREASYFSNGEFLKNFSSARDGLLEKMTVFNPDGSIKAFVKTTYHDFGEIDFFETYVDGKLVSKCQYKYNKENQLILQESAACDGTNNKTTVKYSQYSQEFGIPMRVEVFENEATEPIKAEYGYKDLNTNLYSRKLYYKGEYRNSEIYNEHMDVVEKQYCNDGEHVLSELKNDFKYDSQGNWILMSTLNYVDRRQSTVIERKIEYYPEDWTKNL